MLRKIVRVGRRPAQEQTWSDDETIEGDETSQSDETDGKKSNEDESSGSINEETWVEWIQRATYIAEVAAAKVKVTDWVGGQRKRKWGLAGHTMRREDGRWSRAVLDWRPQGTRKVGHPITRWTDSLDSFADAWKFDWKQKATNRVAWARWANRFATT